MKVVCIDKGSYYLTVGKVYDVDSYDTPVFEYWIFNDMGVRHGVEEELFVELSEVRNDKLKELGI